MRTATLRLLISRSDLLFRQMRIDKHLIFAAALSLVLTFHAAIFAESEMSAVGSNRMSAKAENFQSTSESETISVKSETNRPADFYSVLDGVLVKRGLKRTDVCDESDAVQKRILNEYGAVFLADGRVRPPPICLFTSDEAVKDFQSSAVIGIEEIDGVEIELQAEAMAAYLNARREAQSYGLDITPRDGAEAGRRSFADTLRLWNTRFLPATGYWLTKGRLSAAQVEKLKSMPVNEQVREVLNLEKRGIFFNSSFNNSILYSVAAPGTSQHLSMLALDVNEYGNKKVREILARYGWFRTVRNDAPHFTFLNHKKDDLKKIGLKKIAASGGEYWIPNV